MLAARDQENLVHGHQTVAAAKPLNQSIRQLPPKTPSNKIPKTPFKLPLNDENGAGLFGEGKGGAKTNGKGNENLKTGGKKTGLGDKNAFVTPMGPRNRAPLGMKTTNARANFPTPAPGPQSTKLGSETMKASASRRPKPRAFHAETTKLGVLDDQDELEEPEIEYMPPRPKDLPDHPDDLPELDLSVLRPENLTRGCLGYFANRPGPDGISHVERERMKEKAFSDKLEKEIEAKMQRDIDSMGYPCTHYPECPGEDCKDALEARKEAEEKFQKTMAALNNKPVPVSQSQPKPKPAENKAPSTLSSKSAATALSQPRPKAPVPPRAKPNTTNNPLKSKLPSSLISSRKRTPPPTNPSPMRHAAAIAASKTTMGYSRGRTTSNTLRKSNNIPSSSTDKENKPKTEIPDTTLTPADYVKRYGVPPVGSAMWIRCTTGNLFGDDDIREADGVKNLGGDGRGIEELIREEAEVEFVWKL